MPKPSTKIICTLGPSSDSVTEITSLLQAGMDIARLNFSHGDHADHLRIIKNLRTAAKKLGKKIEILQDLQGPKIRVANLEQEIKIKKGQIVKIVTTKTNSPDEIPIQYKKIIQDLEKGDRIFIDDGKIELSTEKVAKDYALCKVKVGGTIKSRKGLNLPDSNVSAATITSKDRDDLKFGLKNKVDFIALSFVKDATDMKELRKLIGRHKIRTIAKIERPQAVENIHEIAEESDGIMVARGDLGIEIPPETLPVVQKHIIHASEEHGKFTILATQVLNSMVENPRPTRAELSDAANAIFDHADAIMLSNETSVGKYPDKAVRVLRKVSRSVEKEMKRLQRLKKSNENNRH